MKRALVILLLCTVGNGALANQISGDEALRLVHLIKNFNCTTEASSGVCDAQIYTQNASLSKEAQEIRKDYKFYTETFYRLKMATGTITCRFIKPTLDSGSATCSVDLDGKSLHEYQSLQSNN